jgi:copper chaperone CopZ
MFATMRGMKNTIFIGLCAVVLLSASCRRSDIREAEIHIPEMRNRECAMIIIQALSRTPGVKMKNMDDVKIDFETRRVTVEYESLHLARKNIEFAVANAGFSANGVPANKKAAEKLPPQCKGPKAEPVNTKNDS